MSRGFKSEGIRHGRLIQFLGDTGKHVALAITLSLAVTADGSAVDTGSCCNNGGYCTVTTQAMCLNGVWTLNGDCDPNPCQPRWAQPTVGPKRALLFPRPYYLTNPTYGFQTGEADTAAIYDLVASAALPEEMNSVRALNSTVIGLYPVTLWGVPNEDYEGSYEMPGWALEDTLWSPIRKLQHAYIMNLAEDVDWGYLETDNDHIVIWNFRACNWTDECPLGVWGDTAGLTFREYAQQVFIDCCKHSQFTAAWDGYLFDTLPPACCWYEDVWEYVDYDDDGVSDWCGGTSCIEAREEDEWTIQQADNTEAFLAALLAAKSPTQIIMVGQDHVQTASRTSLNGWKIEDWMDLSGKEPSWIDWWEGTDEGPGGGSDYTGYWEAEEELTGLPDAWQGWDMTTIDAVIDAGWSDSNQKRHARFALGTSMLGDGWFNTEMEGLEDRYTISEEYAWDVQLPGLGSFYHPSDTEWCREYRRVNGDTCVVVVDTLAQDARLDGVHRVKAKASGGGNIKLTGSTYTVSAGSNPVIGKKTGTGAYEYRGYLKFDTNGLLSGGETVEKVELYVDVSSMSLTQPSATKWTVYAGSFISTTIDSGDWAGGSLCTQIDWEDDPFDSFHDLGSTGVSQFNNTGYTDICIRDVSLYSGSITWSTTLTTTCKLRVSFSGGGSRTLSPIGSLESSAPLSSVPVTLALQSWPQPIRGSGSLRLSLPQDGQVRVGVHDVQGRRVAVVADTRMEAGIHDLSFRPRDLGIGAGVFFVRANAGERTVQAKVVVLD